jgi:hypothetical protein
MSDVKVTYPELAAASELENRLYRGGLDTSLIDDAAWIIARHMVPERERTAKLEAKNAKLRKLLSRAHRHIDWLAGVYSWAVNVHHDLSALTGCDAAGQELGVREWVADYAALLEDDDE